MAQITISTAVHGPFVPMRLNSRQRTLRTGERTSVTLDELAVLDHAGIVYDRYWRFTYDDLGTLTLTGDTVTDAAEVNDVVGAIQGGTTGSTFEMTDDAGGLFALSGTNIVVADELTADTYEIKITEFNEEIVTAPKTTTFQITVTASGG